MGSKPRRYPVGGDPVAEKHEVTKEEILALFRDLACAVRSQREIIMPFARRHLRDHPGVKITVNDLTWARQVIDFPAAGRLLEKMVKDGLIVARGGGEWVSLGVGGCQAHGTYYALREHAEFLDRRAEGKRAMRRREEAAERATRTLVSENYERYKELIDRYYAEALEAEG